MSFLSPITSFFDPLWQYFNASNTSTQELPPEVPSPEIVEQEPVDIDDSIPPEMPDEDTTDIQINQVDTSTMSVAALLQLINVEHRGHAHKKISITRENVHKLIGAFKAMKAVMAELEASQASNPSQIKVQDLPKLQEAIAHLKNLGHTHPLMDKETLSKTEIDGILKFLQHKTGSMQQDLGILQSQLSEAVEQFNTVTQALLKILSDMRQTIHAIFAQKSS